MRDDTTYRSIAVTVTAKLRYCHCNRSSLKRESEMETVFEASNNLEAHMVLHQLQNAGLEARIIGEHLQGGIGELPAAGNIRVVTRAEDALEARTVIAEWEAS
jgi:hypothetical protein